MSADTERTIGFAPVRGTRVDGMTVHATVHANGRSAVYQARCDDGTLVALKVVSERDARRLIAEARVLERLAGCDTPKVVAHGELEGGAYLATTWRRGVDARVAAAELRDVGAREALLTVCTAVLRAFAEVHERGVVHGAVHPRNVLVDSGGNVSLLGAAAVPEPLGTLSSPAEASAWVDGGRRGRTDARDEQYSLAALLYLLVTGRLYFRPARTRGEVARQILAETQDPFEEPWPELERLLVRAMSKDPSRRFESVREFAGEVSSLCAHPRPPVRQAESGSSALERHLTTFLDETRLDGPLFLRGIPVTPNCSVAFGAAGVAFTLHRIARLRDDASVMVAARAWIEKAERDQSVAGAFYDAGDCSEAVLGRLAPWHAVNGLSLVGGLISRGRGHRAAERHAIDTFVERSEEPCDKLDLWLGRCAALLGAALLLRDADPIWPATERLERRGDQLMAQIWNEFSPATMRYLGVAHGWAGVVYATLMWCRARGVTPPPRAREVLDDLAGLAEAYGRGLRWPWRTDDAIDGSAYWGGWCGGQAGHVFVWTLAASTYADPALLEYAERAAWTTWERPEPTTSLCCGAAGQSYALLNFYRASGERVWLERARALANLSAENGVPAGDRYAPTSLYKGQTGLALLAADLRRPELARMPLFE